MWCDNINLFTNNFSEDYVFKSSPESCITENSFGIDQFEGSSESISDEDFMTQLSSDLDIPLLLNPGDDEMGVLNSFLDKSPDEILSEVTPIHPFLQDCEMKDEMDMKEFDLLFSEKDIKPNNVQLPINNENFNHINEAATTNSNNTTIKTEIHSDESCSSRNSPPPQLQLKSNSPLQVPNILPKQEIIVSTPGKINPQPQSKVALKRVPILKPKVPVTSSNIVLINEFTNSNSNNNYKKIVVLDNIPVNGFNYINKPVVNMPQVTVNSNNRNIDPKILKRQERRIKNRESASISRKKKKEYLNLLEEQIQVLKIENQHLLEENKRLGERLALYEHTTTTSKLTFNNITKISKPAIALCVFLLVVGINLNMGSFRPGFIPNPNKIESNSLKLSNYHGRGRNLLWAQEDIPNQKLDNKTYFSPLTMCPASINQTESARLLLELEKWIGKPEFNNPSINSTKQKPNQPKRKKLRIDLSLAQVKKRDRFGPRNEIKNEIQVFRPNEDQGYSDFYDAINRQGDTFYVVSFSDQHMLLPALRHNNTRRPKMSLLMPSVFPNDTTTQTYFSLMQIDCEVLDTKLVHIKYAAIPTLYRQYGNLTRNDSGKDGSDGARKSSKEAYRPYFLDKSHD